jgi:hypothetical protein
MSEISVANILPTRTRSIGDLRMRRVKIADCVVTACDDGCFLRVTPAKWFKKGDLHRFPVKTWGTSVLDRRVISMLIADQVKVHQLDFFDREQVEEMWRKKYGGESR